MGRSDNKADMSGAPVDQDQLADFARLYEKALTRYFAKRGCQDHWIQG